MNESMKALVAEVQEITGKGRGEQKIEMPLQRMRREEAQLATKPGMKYLGVELGSPDWETITCPQCKSEVRYYTSRYYEPPYVRLKCPICKIDLGIIGAAGGLIEVVTAQAWPPTIPPVPIYTCPHCGATFESPAELAAHIESEHPAAPPPPTPITGFAEFLKKYWPHLTATGLGIALVGTVIVKYGKKR